MKTRQGFVSNSSTSSFVLIGFKISEDKKQKLIETSGMDDWYECLESYGLDQIPEIDVDIVGEFLSTEDDGHMEWKEISLSQLNKIVDDIRTKLEIPQEHEPILVTGTMSC